MGDDQPFDDKAQGFDTIIDNPNFAGGTTSFWQRQQIPFVFGGGVVIQGQNSIVPSLRSSKIEGQSNFVNPGLWLGGVGADFDILPELRLVANASYLAWDTVQVIEVLRQQERLDREIGWDLSDSSTGPSFRTTSSSEPPAPSCFRAAATKSSSTNAATSRRIRCCST